MKRLFIFLLAFTLIGVLGIGKAEAQSACEDLTQSYTSREVSQTAGYKLDYSTFSSNPLDYSFDSWSNSVLLTKNAAWLADIPQALWISYASYPENPTSNELILFKESITLPSDAININYTYKMLQITQ